MPQLLGGTQKPSQNSSATDMSQDRRFSELSERTRLLEERLKQARERIQVIDETNIGKIRELRDTINSLNEEMTSARKNLDDLKEIVRRIAKDMGSVARVSDVHVLEKYIGMMDITRLVTKDDVLRIVKDEISRSKEKKK
jgi:predicted glycosyltransferase